MKQSIINWQKGEPKEKGMYLVSINGNYSIYVASAVYMHERGWCHWEAEEIVAWCKLSDIEPCKEEEA